MPEVKFVDLNGTGDWSRQRIQERYDEHCQRLGIPSRELVAEEYLSEEGRWVYPVMHDVIAGLADGDPACVAIGVEFVETDERIPFGPKFKYQTARALRRTELKPEQVLRLRKRIVSMLIAGIHPKYFKEFAKLLRTIGAAECWPELDTQIPLGDPYAMRHYRTIRMNDPTAPPE